MLFWPFTVWINCSSGLNFFQAQIWNVFLDPENNFFLTVGQNNFGNKIPFCSVQLEMQDAIFLAFENRLSTYTHFKLLKTKGKNCVLYLTWKWFTSNWPLKIRSKLDNNSSGLAAQKQLWDFLQIWGKIFYEVAFSIVFFQNFQTINW